MLTRGGPSAWELDEGLTTSDCKRLLQNVSQGYRIGWSGLWQALVNMVMNLEVLEKVGNFLNSCMTFSFLRRTLLHGVSWLRLVYFSLV
jgi:hypothetical protein